MDQHAEQLQEDAPKPRRKPYVAPAVEESGSFERLALVACGQSDEDQPEEAAG